MSNQPSSISPMADVITSNIIGQETATMFLATVQSHFADPDTLYSEFKFLIPEITDIKTLSTIRGFCRAIQKHIEVR
ncbi:hypothetical protein [Undibacterium sp. SXout20W]|uniref:hypothetical protein n=1 Tax=Undibacterium sp. SXout20W TaxID=3413051 RepID=UPI003BF09E47